MKKLLLATLFAGFALSAQAQDIPKECKEYLEYMKTTVEAKKNGPSKAEIEKTFKGAQEELAAAVKQNGEKAVAAGCVEMLNMLKEMNSK
ncbi:hypothetical protein ACWIYZ_03540 [Ursidibacter arcticus]